MSDGAAFIPGRYPKQGGPLQRYLPPLMEGPASRWLEERVQPGSWVLDPFGTSPRLAVEIARSGYRLLAAVNNPIARFLIELYANPPSEAELVAALADLGSAQKAGERIEPQIRALFKTECAHCGGAIEAQAFIWESESNTLVGKIVSCPFCKESGEQPINEADLGRSARSSGGSLYRARALERVAPLSDPDRTYAEEALAVYPPRTLHALFDVINRLDTIPQHHRRAASALLLAAFDQASGLWHQPPVKSRPRQLNLPQRYLEKNVWKAMELAVISWSDAFGELNSVGTASQVSCWPDLPAETNGICLFEGRLKDLAAEIQTSSLHALEIAAVIGALPRPNQAFWTLSALWAGWLWGSSASGPFKSVLRRRRYDWGWHTVALTAALTGVSELTLQGTPMMGLIGEIEPGFISAALLAAEFSGFELEGTALRIEPELAQLSWRRGTERLASMSEETDRRRIIRSALLDFLRENGEPAAYLKLHTAALCGLIRSNAISSPDDSSPADLIHQIEDSLAEVLTRGSQFARFGAGGRSLDAGRWWLGESSAFEQNVSLPLADRVEMLVVRCLMSSPVINLHEIESAVFSELRDLFTPDFPLIQACLDSYGEQLEGESEIWRLRQKDQPAARRADLAEMQALLTELGRRLGFQVDISDQPGEIGLRPPLFWRDETGSVKHQFHISASALLGRVLTSVENPVSGGSQAKRFIVLPGGRSNLVELKLRRDGRLKAIVENDWRFLKYRHIRSLAENENLSRQNLDVLLHQDPPANRDPQMPLL